MACRYCLRSKFVINASRSLLCLQNGADIRTLTLARNYHGETTNKTSLKKEKEKLRGYVMTRYVDYVTNYKKLLEVRFPSAMNMYRIFSVGLKDFYRDLKLYVPRRLRLPPTEHNLSKFSREEIELYYKMPKDMWKITPVLILSAVPFGNYIIFPLALMKPRILLTSHFWSMQQRAEFSVLELQNRLAHSKGVFDSVYSALSSLVDEDTKSELKAVLAGLEYGVHPTAKQILRLKPLFCDKPYHLKHLGHSHALHLLKMHGLHRGLLRRKRLHYRALILQQVDRAIGREGGPDALSTDCLRGACLMRGLNSSHLSRQAMIDWMAEWIAVSSELNKESYSLLLHCPLLLAYNHPQNWKLRG